MRVCSSFGSDFASVIQSFCLSYGLDSPVLMNLVAPPHKTSRKFALLGLDMHSLSAAAGARLYQASKPLPITVDVKANRFCEQMGTGSAALPQLPS